MIILYRFVIIMMEYSNFTPFLIFIIFDVLSNNKKNSINSVLEILVFSIVILFYSFINPIYGYIICIIMIFYLLYEKHKNRKVRENMTIEIANNQSDIIKVIESLNENEDINEETIPKKIIQVFIQFPNSIQRYTDYDKYINTIKKQNPSFEYLYFDDDKIEVFLKKYYPEYYETYKKLPVYVQKVDFFRYIAIYHYGGFYFDLDIKMLKSIDESLLSHNCIFPVDEYITYSLNIFDRYKPFFEKNNNFLLGQYAFAAIPKHPFIKKLIDDIHKNVDSYIKNKDNSELYVYRTTGPDYVTNEYINYNNKSQIYILNNGKRQYFGDYAKHDYLGTWKRNKSN